MNALVEIITGKITDLKMELGDCAYNDSTNIIFLNGQICILEKCLVEYFQMEEK